MNNALRSMTGLLALVGALGLAHADGEGGPGDSGMGGASASASAASGHGQMKHAARKTTSSHKPGTGAKRANGSPDAASGTKSDGPMSNTPVGKGG